MFKYNFLFFVSLGAFGLSAPLFAQTGITAIEYIKTQQNQDQLGKLQQAQYEEMGQLDGRLPYIEQVQFRTETNEFVRIRQEYTARVSTNGLAERRAQKALNESNQGLVHLDYQAWAYKVNAQAYEDLVDWAGHQANMDWYTAKKLSLEDKATVLKKTIQYEGSKSFDDLFKVESDLEDLEIAKLDDILAISFFQKKSNGAERLETEKWLSPEAMLLKMQAEMAVLPDHLSFASYQNKLYRNSLEYKLEQAKGRQVLDYMQIRYTDKEKTQAAGDISLGLGINIPWRGSSKVDLYEVKIDEMEIKREAAEDKQVLEQKMFEITEKATLMAGILAKTKEHHSTAQKNNNLQKLNATQNTHPLTLLNIQLLDLQRQKRILDLEQDVRKLYIEWLDVSGRAGILKEVSWLED